VSAVGEQCSWTALAYDGKSTRLRHGVIRKDRVEAVGKLDGGPLFVGDPLGLSGVEWR
jgi:hypothetical protein